jgi:hypothetical protein
VTIKTAHLVIGVDVDGRKHALGCWIAEAEGASRRSGCRPGTRWQARPSCAQTEVTAPVEKLTSAAVKNFPAG